MKNGRPAHDKPTSFRLPAETLRELDALKRIYGLRRRSDALIFAVRDRLADMKGMKRTRRNA